MRRVVTIAAALAIAGPAAAAETLTYSYDARGRVVQVVRSGSVNNGVAAAYSFDRAQTASPRRPPARHKAPPPDTPNQPNRRIHMNTSLSRRAAFCALLAGTSSTAPALAQLPGSIPAPPGAAVDNNGVDVLRGTFNTSQTPVSIGPDAENGFAYTFQSFNAGYRDAFQAFLSYNGSTYTVTLNGVTDSFTYNGTSFENDEGNGNTLHRPAGHAGLYDARRDNGEFPAEHQRRAILRRAPISAADDRPAQWPEDRVSLQEPGVLPELAYTETGSYCTFDKNRVAQRLQSV